MRAGGQIGHEGQDLGDGATLADLLDDRTGRRGPVVILRPLLGRAKDIGSAAVLLSLLNWAGIWLAALVHHFSRAGA